MYQEERDKKGSISFTKNFLKMQIIKIYEYCLKASQEKKRSLLRKAFCYARGWSQTRFRKS